MNSLFPSNAGSGNGGGSPPSESPLVRGVSICGGVIISFFATPLVFDFTKGSIKAFTAAHYAEFLTGLAAFAWFIVLAVGIFFVGRLIVSDAIRNMRARIAAWGL